MIVSSLAARLLFFGTIPTFLPLSVGRVKGTSIVYLPPVTLLRVQYRLGGLESKRRTGTVPAVKGFSNTKNNTGSGIFST